MKIKNIRQRVVFRLVYILCILLICSISACANKKDSEVRQSDNIDSEVGQSDDIDTSKITGNSYNALDIEAKVNDKDKTEGKIEDQAEAQVEITDEITPIKERELKINQINLSEFFGGLKGGAVFYHIETDEYDVYNEEFCKEEDSPYSTFKIIMTLIGSHEGILESSETKMGYDGTKYPMDNWNKDLTLKEAFEASCVWYYKKLMNQLDHALINEQLEKLGFGNMDTSGWTNEDTVAFWLDSTLKISPYEWVDIVKDILDGKTVYSEKDIALLKEIMVERETSKGNIYGKTGTGKTYQGSEAGNGWFVGYYMEEEMKYIFAVHIVSPNEVNRASGNIAANIAREVIDQHY